MTHFSSRHGFKGAATEITVREDAPEDLRAAILLLARDAGITPHPLRDLICGVLLKRPDPNNWSEYPNIWYEVNSLIDDCAWFRVYDIAEALHDYLLKRGEAPAAAAYQDRLNQFFIEHGIGWSMEDGQIFFRGSETFGDTTAEATQVLSDTGHNTAAREVHEALRDISRRPDPDVTGAIQHAIAALECTARDVTGNQNATLGRLSGQLNLPPPLGSAVEKLWGFASERARHIREGETVSVAEAELVVSTACALCTFLARR